VLTWANAAHAQEEQSSAPVSGKDISRPLQRFDLRTEFDGEGDDTSAAVTFRYDRPVDLGNDWGINLRGDLPVKIEEGGDTGVGDALVQAIFTHRVNEHEGFGFGTQVRIPTGKQPFGRGQWQFLPTAGYRWLQPEISKDSFFQFIARYHFSSHGSGKPTISELQFTPNLEIDLPGKAYISIFPSTDFRYDFRADRLFVPLDLEVGKEQGRIIGSIEGAVGLLSRDDGPYKWKVEVRLGYRF